MATRLHLTALLVFIGLCLSASVAEAVASCVWVFQTGVHEGDTFRGTLTPQWPEGTCPASQMSYSAVAPTPAGFAMDSLRSPSFSYTPTYGSAGFVGLNLKVRCKIFTSVCDSAAIFFQVRPPLPTTAAPTTTTSAAAAGGSSAGGEGHSHSVAETEESSSDATAGGASGAPVDTTSTPAPTLIGACPAVPLAVTAKRRASVVIDYGQAPQGEATEGGPSTNTTGANESDAEEALPVPIGFDLGLGECAEGHSVVLRSASPSPRLWSVAGGSPFNGSAPELVASPSGIRSSAIAFNVRRRKASCGIHSATFEVFCGERPLCNATQTIVVTKGEKSDKSHSHSHSHSNNSNSSSESLSGSNSTDDDDDDDDGEENATDGEYSGGDGTAEGGSNATVSEEAASGGAFGFAPSAVNETVAGTAAADSHSNPSEAVVESEAASGPAAQNVSSAA